MRNTYRCSLGSLDAREQMAGSAPTDARWLLVEYAGAWGRQAVAESRLSEGVRQLLGGLPGVRVQLIRRPHGAAYAPNGVTVIAASLSRDATWVEMRTLDHVDDLLELDLAPLSHGTPLGWTPRSEPLWLVCTNGSRDLCCAELGRPIAAAVAQEWPEGTWETTHLGGHRFSGTLLALPTGVVLGRLQADDAVAACHAVAAGKTPPGLTRGRAGRTPSEQVAELHVVAQGARLDSLATTMGDEQTVLVRGPSGSWRVRIETVPGAPALLSCADERPKDTAQHRVLEVLAVDG